MKIVWLRLAPSPGNNPSVFSCHVACKKCFCAAKGGISGVGRGRAPVITTINQKWPWPSLHIIHTYIASLRSTDKFPSLLHLHSIIFFPSSFECSIVRFIVVDSAYNLYDAIVTLSRTPPSRLSPDFRSSGNCNRREAIELLDLRLQAICPCYPEYRLLNSLPQTPGLLARFLRSVDSRQLQLIARGS